MIPSDDLIEALIKHTKPMTDEEMKAQQESWVRGMTTHCEHGVLDFEQCPECRAEKGAGKCSCGAGNPRAEIQIGARR